MTFKWKREQIEKLISCIQQNPCIYNAKSMEYLNRIKKDQAFNSVLEEMRKLESTFTLFEIKRKWRNLRTQYMQEVRMIKASKKSSSGRLEPYLPKLWCFKQLDFLTHTEAITEDEDNKNRMSGLCEEEILSEESPTKRLKSIVTINDFRSDLKSFKNILSQRKAGTKYAWLGSLVANQMTEIDPDYQADAAWQVQCLIRKLTNNSGRNRSSSPTSSSKDILGMSMKEIFDEEEFN